MSRAGKWVLSMLLWTWGGAAYFLLEVAYKTATGHPEHISWTMLVLAMVLCIPIERCGAELPWEVPLPLQAFICAALVTLTELIAGLLLNVWLGLGQICPQFAVLWWGLCLILIPGFDSLRYAVEGGERPHYTFF